MDRKYPLVGNIVIPTYNGNGDVHEMMMGTGFGEVDVEVEATKAGWTMQEMKGLARSGAVNIPDDDILQGGQILLPVSGKPNTWGGRVGMAACDATDPPINTLGVMITWTRGMDEEQERATESQHRFYGVCVSHSPPGKTAE